MSTARQARFIDPFEPREIRRLVAEFGSPLLIVDCERVRTQYRQLQDALPGVDLHYALKPLPHPAVIDAVHAAGASFEVASRGEVDLLERHGVPIRGCLHTHPVKTVADLLGRRDATLG